MKKRPSCVHTVLYRVHIVLYCVHLVLHHVCIAWHGMAWHGMACVYVYMYEHAFIRVRGHFWIQGQGQGSQLEAICVIASQDGQQW